MPFQSDKQRKGFFANLNNPTKAPLSPSTKAVNKNPQLKNMNFRQLKKKGIFLKFQADSDKDGKVNVKDCKPLDPKRQGRLHDIAMGLLKKKEQFLENKRVNAMNKLEETREKLAAQRAVKEVKNQKLQAKQAVIDEIKKEERKIQELKELNKQARQKIFQETVTGKTIGKSKEAIQKTQAFFEKPSTKRFFKKLGKVKI